MNLDIDFEIMREPGFYTDVLKKRKQDIVSTKEVGLKPVVQCPICGTPNKENKNFYNTEFGDYLKCKTCSCIYLDTVAKKQNVGRYSKINKNLIESLPEEKKREYRKQRFGEERVNIIDRFLEKPLSKASLLDVGCNTGFFIEKAKEHINDVCGLEKEKVLADYAEQRTGCKIYTCDIGSIPRKFDAITLFDTVEHLEDPVSFLKKCSSLLNNGGLLFFITPNYKSFGFDVLNEACTHIIPGHLSLFCEETCDYLYSKLNLKPVLYQTCGMDIFDIFAYLRDICHFDLSTNFDNDKMNGLQCKLNKLGYGNSLRSVLVNEVKNVV